MIKEIEIHSAEIINGIVNIDYTIYSGESEIDVSKRPISKKELLRYIEDSQINRYCLDVMTGDYNELDSADYLVDNLNDVVKMYLIENLK